MRLAPDELFSSNFEEEAEDEGLDLDMMNKPLYLKAAVKAGFDSKGNFVG